MRRRILRRLVWVCTICLRPTKMTLGLDGLTKMSHPFLSPEVPVIIGILYPDQRLDIYHVIVKCYRIYTKVLRRVQE